MEKLDLCLSDHHIYARLSPKTIEPLAESKDEIWVMRQIAERVGGFEPKLFEEPLLALKKATTGAFENGSFDELFNGTILKLRQRPANEYQTPSGKIELYSSGAIGIGANPLPAQLPLSFNENWFTLLNSALPSWTHSQFRDVYGPIPQIVWINVFDAKNLEIENGQNVSLFNGSGEVTVEAVVTNKVSRRVLWCPRPLTGKNGVPLNSLSSSDPQTLGATSRFNSTKVKIQKLR
jgi:anaerobic selenocysteine-containing dehydrogenase